TDGIRDFHVTGVQTCALLISLLILDEATANIDSETEARVEKALDALLEGRQAIIVAHRLSTVKRADKILVLEDGRITQTGTHDEDRKSVVRERVYTAGAGAGA